MTAGGLLAFNLTAKATAAGRLNLFPGGVEGLQMDGSTPVIKISLRVQNTSNQVLVLQSLAGNLWANGYMVGNVWAAGPLPITRNSETDVILKIRLSAIGVVQNIIDAWQQGHFSQIVEFKGTANVDKYQVPFSFQYKIGP